MVSQEPEIGKTFLLEDFLGSDCSVCTGSMGGASYWLHLPRCGQDGMDAKANTALPALKERS